MIDIKPQFQGVEKSEALFQTTTTTYSDTDVTYSSSTQKYGGFSGVIQNAPPQLLTTIDIKPRL